MKGIIKVLFTGRNGMYKIQKVKDSNSPVSSALNGSDDGT